MDISKESYHLQKYLESKVYLSLQVFQREWSFANNFDDRRRLASSFRNFFLRATRHQGCLV
jgi:hypothetical protein